MILVTPPCWAMFQHRSRSRRAWGCLKNYFSPIPCRLKLKMFTELMFTMCELAWIRVPSWILRQSFPTLFIYTILYTCIIIYLCISIVLYIIFLLKKTESSIRIYNDYTLWSFIYFPKNMISHCQPWLLKLMAHRPCVDLTWITGLGRYGDKRFAEWLLAGSNKAKDRGG